MQVLEYSWHKWEQRAFGTSDTQHSLPPQLTNCHQSESERSVSTFFFLPERPSIVMIQLKSFLTLIGAHNTLKTKKNNSNFFLTCSKTS
jgi:hypothetical protein